MGRRSISLQTVTPTGSERTKIDKILTAPTRCSSSPPSTATRTQHTAQAPAARTVGDAGARVPRPSRCVISHACVHVSAVRQRSACRSAPSAPAAVLSRTRSMLRPPAAHPYLLPPLTRPPRPAPAVLPQGGRGVTPRRVIPAWHRRAQRRTWALEAAEGGRQVAQALCRACDGRISARTARIGALARAWNRQCCLRGLRIFSGAPRSGGRAWLRTKRVSARRVLRVRKDGLPTRRSAFNTLLCGTHLLSSRLITYFASEHRRATGSPGCVLRVNRLVSRRLSRCLAAVRY